MRIDNAGEFTSKSFDEFCITLGIDVQYPVPHVHFQNGMAEALIKRLKWIARPLLMQSQLPANAWGHAILHAQALIQYRPCAFNDISPYQIALGSPPDLSHLKCFGCQVMVPIPPPRRTKMGPQKSIGIYVGFDSPSIIRYLEPTTGDIFKARFLDCHFTESIFPKLCTQQQECTPCTKEQIKWNADWHDPRTGEGEREVQRILRLHRIMEEMPDSFNDAMKITKSHVPAANTPARISTEGNAAVEHQTRIKRGRPLGSKDLQPRQKRSKPQPDLVLEKRIEIQDTNTCENTNYTK